MAEIALLAVIFTAAALARVLTEGLPLPAEAAYILIGVFITQTVFVPDIALLAEVGAVFVIFFTTMHLRTDAIRSVLPDALVVTSVYGILLLIITAGGIMAGFNHYESILLGLVTTLSSSMLGVRLIENQVDRQLIHGRLTEGVNFTQDLILVLIIGMLPFWPSTGATLLGAAGAGGMVLLILLLRDPVNHALALLERHEETTLLVGLAMLWGLAAIAAPFAYSTILAAIAAGLLLSGHPDNFTLLETIEPIKDFFATLFFVTLGILVVPQLGSGITLAVLLLVAITILRPLITTAILRIRGHGLHTSITTALQLDQASEIVLLLGLVFHLNGLIEPAVTHAVIIASAGSFIISSYTTAHTDRLYHSIVSLINHSPDQLIDRDGHCIVAGYGTWGRPTAAALDDPIIVDNDPDVIRRAAEDGYDTITGDINDRTTWHRAGISTAQAVILTVPSDTVAAHLATHDITLIAVTETQELAQELEETGVAFASDTATLASRELTQRLDAYLSDR